jgi:hypothetical protein
MQVSQSLRGIVSCGSIRSFLQMSVRVCGMQIHQLARLYTLLLFFLRLLLLFADCSVVSLLPDCLALLLAL